MAKILRFQLTGVTAPIVNGNYTILHGTTRECLGTGLFNSDANGNVSIDAGNALIGEENQKVIVLNDNYTGTNPDTFNSAVGVTPILFEFDVSPTNIEKVVLLGASITGRIGGGHINLMRAWIQGKYGRTVDFVNEAVAGRSVGDWLTVPGGQTKSRLQSVIDTYAGEPNTHFYVHVGGNDITQGTPFNGLTQATQDQKFAQLREFHDVVAASGKKLFQSSLTFRNYNGTTLDNDPATKVNELNGSFTYNRDWVDVVIGEKTPQLISGGVPRIDLYNLTRNSYFMWADGADPVHPNHHAVYIMSVHIAEAIGNFIHGIDPGETPTQLTPRNFNTPTLNGLPIDIVVGFTTNYNDDTTHTPLINWVQGGTNTATREFFLENLKDTSGNALQGVNLCTVTRKGWHSVGGNVGDPTNNTASLANNQLLSTYLRQEGLDGSMCVVIEGLEPFSNYTLETVSVSGVSATPSRACRLWTNSNVPATHNMVDAGNPETRIITNVVTTDANGRLFVTNQEAHDGSVTYAGFNGIRVRSAG